MKKISYPCADYYIGTAREIKTLENNFYNKTEYMPVFCDEPRFNMDKMYGIRVDFGIDGEGSGNYMVVSETDVVHLLLGEVDKLKSTIQDLRTEICM